MLEATIAYRILTSREVLTGADGLDGINTTPVNQGAVVLASGSLFRLDRNSAAAPDGVTVIAPSAGPGRWILLASANGVDISVVDLAALAALGASTPNLCWVESLKCYWHRDLASVLAPDGITVVAALGGGNWERIVPTTSLDWLSQAAWAIDPVGGDDENNGGPGAPLATTAELDRRLSVGPIAQHTLVLIAPTGPLPVIDFTIDTAEFTFSIVGVPTVVHTGVVTTYTDRVHATPISARLTEAAFDFTPFEGYRLRITNGAAVGAFSWIDKANPGGAGVNVASVSRFSTLALPTSVPTGVVPAGGVGYVIESLPRAAGIYLRQRNRFTNTTLAFYVSSLSFNQIAATADMTVDACCRVVTDGCFVDGPITSLHGRRDVPQWKRSRLGGGLAQQVQISGQAQLQFCLVNAQCTPIDGGNISLLSVLISPTNNTINGFYTDLLNGFGQYLMLDDVQIFGSSTALYLQVPCCVHTRNGLSGDGNAIGVSLGSSVGGNSLQGIMFAWVRAADLPNLLGTTTPIRVQGTAAIDLVWAAMPFKDDEQKGIGTLTNGTATITARNALARGVVVSKATGSGAARGTVEAPTATRTATQFVVNAVDAAGALVAGDQSTFDWLIPPMARNICLCQADSLLPPV